ncbi:MAG: PHP domain-containing protein [Clostridia bacterium]|nr:PHP domain-containing protein [Clostridia bacterium]
MFKYEMHCHSLPSGGGAPIEEHIDHLISLGFSGLVITNHFLWGATALDRTMPWNEFVDHYRRDWEEGREYGAKKDFDVLFGVEEHIGGGKEILVYGLTPDFFYANPELADHDLKTYSRLVRAAGGIILQAHPHRVRHYMPDPGPVADLSLLDGIEVYNATNKAEENEAAEKLAAENPRFILTGGSDAHGNTTAGRGGISSPRRIKTGAELVALLSSKEHGIVR